MHQMPSLSVSLDQIQKIGKIDSILFIYYLFIYLKLKKTFWHKIHNLNCLRTF